MTTAQATTPPLLGQHDRHRVCVRCYADVYRAGYPQPDLRDCVTGPGYWEFPTPEPCGPPSDPNRSHIYRSPRWVSDKPKIYR